MQPWPLGLENVFLKLRSPGHPEENPYTHQECRKSERRGHGHRPRGGPRVFGDFSAVRL